MVGRKKPTARVVIDRTRTLCRDNDFALTCSVLLPRKRSQGVDRIADLIGGK